MGFSIAMQRAYREIMLHDPVGLDFFFEIEACETTLEMTSVCSLSAHDVSIEKIRPGQKKVVCVSLDIFKS